MSDVDMEDASPVMNGNGTDVPAAHEYEKVPGLMDDGYRHFQRIRLVRRRELKTTERHD